jgi:hypothetical protein
MDVTMSHCGTALIAVAAILAGGACANAAVSPGKSAYFHPICQEAVKTANGMANDPTASANCFGFIQGVRDTHDHFRAGKFCPPKVVSIGQMAQVWVSYMDAEPKVLILPPVETLLDALRSAFPCQG